VPTFNPRAATPRAMAPHDPPMLTVKAVVDQVTGTDGVTYESPRVVYDIQDMPIPHEDFVTTPLTSSLVLAIMAGDLEEMEPTPAIARMRLPAEFGGRLKARATDEPQPEQPPPVLPVMTEPAREYGRRAPLPPARHEPAE
jgi:hypothetical protein